MPNDATQQPTFNSEQISDLKRLAIAGILGGSTLAGLKYIRPGALFNSKPQVIGSPVVEVPVPGQEPLPNSNEFFEKIRKQKSKGKGKKVQPFKPSARVAMQEEKQAFSSSNLVNPAYLPAATASFMLPGILSYHLLNKLHRDKLKTDHAKELEDAKKEFGEALVESHSNRLNKPIVIDKEAAHSGSSLSSDLEKLASLCLNEKRAVNETYTNLANAIGNMISLPISGAGKLIDLTGSIMKHDPAKVLAGYGGLLGGLGVGGGIIGAAAGYNQAKKNDEEKLQSEKYLNEFLTRRQNEGMPVQSIPVPVKQVGKRLVAKPMDEDSNDQQG